MKLMVWNINQRSSGKKIPPFVSELIMDSNADIVILTEFIGAYKTNGENIKIFKDSLSEKYYTFCNEKRDMERVKANGILIAVKKGFAEITDAPEENLKINYKEKDQPNFLQLNIFVDGKPISIIGTRIQVDKTLTESEFKKRRQQVKSLVEHIVKLGNKNIIVAGDFNNAKIHGAEEADYLSVRDVYSGKGRDKPLVTFDTYNYHIMKGVFVRAGFTVSTPSGEQYSCGFKLDDKYKPSKGYLKEDHIMTKNLKVKNLKYCDDFIRNYKLDVEWELKRDAYAIISPFPDHAILTAEVEV